MLVFVVLLYEDSVRDSALFGRYQGKWREVKGILYSLCVDTFYKREVKGIPIPLCVDTTQGQEVTGIP